MSPEALFLEVRLEQLERLVAVMSGTSRTSIFATARCGRMVLPPGPVYPPTSPSMLIVGCETSRTSESCHDSFSIHRSTPSAFFVGASFFFGIASSRISLRRGQRTHLVEEAVHRRRVTVRLHERVERLHQMPRRAVDLRGEARVHVGLRPASPLLATGDELGLDDALGAEVDLDRAVEPLVA